MVDSSGLRFFYTTEEPEKRAGNLNLGHAVHPTMIIPPRTQNYTITSVCTADCTNDVIVQLYNPIGSCKLLLLLITFTVFA